MEMTADLNAKLPIEVFETLFDEDVVNLIVEQTCLYASQANFHNFVFSENDLKVFLGVLFYTGYHSMPREDMYWQTYEDTCSPVVANNMSRTRFKEIKRFLHLADNSNLVITDKMDKMAKIKPLAKMLSKKFCQYGYMHEKFSIDETMVRYFGSHSSKQFIKGKPVRFDFKNWMLTSSCGYLHQFDTYCGAKGVAATKLKLPLGYRVVIDFLDNVSRPSDHIVFFDNFFTSYDLLVMLKQKGFRAIGNVRESRTKKMSIAVKRRIQKGNKWVRL